MELPLFDQNQAQVARAEFELLQATYLRDAIDREIVQESWAVHARATTAFETAGFMRDELLPLRENGLRLAREAYRVGSTTLLTVLDAQPPTLGGSRGVRRCAGRRRGREDRLGANRRKAVGGRFRSTRTTSITDPGEQTMKMLRYFVILTLLGLPACTRQAEDKAPGEHSDALAGEAAPATNRVDAPESVRRNLGITFATVESRPVAQTIRVPGQFELQPEARREYRTMLDGRVELLVKQFDSVEPGRLLYRLVSPQWRDLQEKLAEAESTIRRTEGRVGSIPTLIASAPPTRRDSGGEHRPLGQACRAARTDARLWRGQCQRADCGA